MGVCESKNDELLCSDSEPVPLEVLDKISKSVCRIKLTLNTKNIYGTGFFMEYNSNKYLITNYHVISEKTKDIEIEIWNKNISELNLNNRFVKYIKKPKDITIIQIHQNEFNDVVYLKYDLNYLNGYSTYINKEVINVGYPSTYGVSGGKGKIKEIDEFEFFHNMPTKEGSSGSPIILYSLLTVVGIHKQAYVDKKLNIGTFIGELIKEMDSVKSKEIDNINKNVLNNYKKNEFPIKNNEINCIYKINGEQIRLLYRPDLIYSCDIIDYILFNEAKNNINEENVEIYVDNEKIKFTYVYKTNKKGFINVKFKIKKLLTSTCSMFFFCDSLETIDLSSFNTNNVTNMMNMFSYCKSLKSIDLSSFNTDNVTNMYGMFWGCESLESIDLSAFNTKNVTNMELMFSGCKSLKSIDLSSFNTKNVTKMRHMFSGCESLKSIDLSSFNTNNVTDMYEMFKHCESLKSIDLSSFNTNNVTNMSHLFNKCSSLKSIDLSSFSSNNVTNMNKIFNDCSSLNKKNIKINRQDKIFLALIN